MKQICLLLLTLYSLLTGAQENQFETPSNPAFTILDFEPSSILRPTSPSELKTNLLSSFDYKGNLKPNIGIEVSPYWLNSNPTLTWKEYARPGVIQSIKQTLSLSFATKEDEILNRTVFGAGTKFQLVPGHIESDAAAETALSANLNIIVITAGVQALLAAGTITTREEVLESLTTALSITYGTTVANSYLNRFRTLAKDYPDTTAGNGALLRAIVLEYNAIAVTIDVKRQRTGIIVELAGAAKLIPSSGDADAALRRAGIWMNIANRKISGEDFILTVRHLNTSSDTTKSNLDAGLSYVRDFDDFNFSIEALLRRSKIEFSDININNEQINMVERDFTYRIAATIQYRINDYAHLNFSVGKDYNKPLVSTDTFFSIAGINFNLFKKIQVE